MATFLRYWLPVIAWLAVIARFSTATFESGTTLAIVRVFMDSLFPAAEPATVELINALVRKMAHVTEYFVLAALLYRAFRGASTEEQQWRWTMLTVLVAVAVAGLDELNQSFIPARTGTPVDVAIDTAGVLLAQPVMRWWYGRNRLATKAQRSQRSPESP